MMFYDSTLIDFHFPGFSLNSLPGLRYQLNQFSNEAFIWLFFLIFPGKRPILPQVNKFMKSLQTGTHD